MPIAITLGQEIDVTLKCDEHLPLEERTVFHIGTLSADVRRRITSLSVRDPGESLYQTVLHGVKGWSNFKDADGNEVAAILKKGFLSDRSMAQIGPYWVELASLVLSSNNLEEADLGNSPSSPKSGAGE